MTTDLDPIKLFGSGFFMLLLTACQTLIPSDSERTLGNEVFLLPDAAKLTVRGRELMTPVEETDYDEYSSHKGRGDIKGTQRRGMYLYYYVQNPIFIHGPQPGGGEGHTTAIDYVTERYKVNLTKRSAARR